MLITAMKSSFFLRKKWIILVTCTLLVTVTILTNSKKKILYATQLIACYNQSGNLLQVLRESEVTLGTSIFFIESSCSSNRSDIKLNTRQACSIESALAAHPTKDVFLLIVSPANVTIEDVRNPRIQILFKYPNFKIRHIEFSRYLLNTPLESVLLSGTLNDSLWPLNHFSDVLRYTTLYKFRGTYLDLDVIVIKPFVNLTNFAGAESKDTIAAGVISFAEDEVGRGMAEKCAEDLARSFNGNEWAANGPGVMTRVLVKRCQEHITTNMTEEKCKGFHVHPVKSFYPVPFRYREFFFMKSKMKTIQNMLQDSYAVHLWNHFTEDCKILDLKIPYLELAKRYCPKIYESQKNTF